MVAITMFSSSISNTFLPFSCSSWLVMSTIQTRGRICTFLQELLMVCGDMFFQTIVLQRMTYTIILVQINMQSYPWNIICTHICRLSFLNINLAFG
jgi:hypothetical protein